MSDRERNLYGLINAFKAGSTARCGNLRTSEGVVWSYGLPIARVKRGRNGGIEVLAPEATRGISVTTSRHANAVRAALGDEAFPVAFFA